MNQPQTTQTFSSSINRSDYDEVRRQQRIIDARVTLAETQIQEFLQEKKQLEKTLWAEIGREQLIGILKEGSYGKSIQVRAYGTYTYDSNASLDASGELLIGGYHNHDHFRYNTPIFVRRDLGQYR